MKKSFIVGIAAATAALAACGDASPWVYLSEESVISNNNAVGRSTDWVLNVSVVDQANHTLAIGKGTPGDAYVLRDGAIVGGATLDLSETVSDSGGNAWTIERFKGSCFRRTEAPTSPMRTFVAPRELVTIDGKIFDYDIPSDEKIEATFDCPLLTALPNGTSGRSWVTLHLKVPSCTYVDQYALSKFEKVDVSAWDWTGVEDIGGLALPWPNYPYGTMKLPRLKTIGNSAFGQANYTRMEWGNRYNTLTSVGEKALNASCEEIVLGCAKGCSFAQNAINAGNLKRVWMTGSVPVFATEEITFGVSQGEKSMVFYVPDTEEWADIRAAATPLTEDEIAAFKAAHPDWDAPFGVVDSMVFQTRNAQYIGTVDLAAMGVMSKITVTSRSQAQYGDSWEISADGKVVEDGEVPVGTEVAVKAIPEKATTLVSWEGKLPNGTPPPPKILLHSRRRHPHRFTCAFPMRGSMMRRPRRFRTAIGRFLSRRPRMRAN